MDNRALAALLSSLISELLLLLFVIAPSDSDSFSFPSSYPISFLSPFLVHFLSISETAASLSFLSKRKRKRTNVSESDAQDDEGNLVSKHARRLRSELGGSDSVIPRDPDSFKLCFRMTSSTFEWLSTLLEPLLECRDPVNTPLNLSAETRLGVGLFRLATGSSYLDISSRFGVSEAVARFCVKQFCRVLCTNFRFWVGFPSPNEVGQLSDSFETLTGLPHCCGVLHCTRFMILKNGAMEDEESIAAQIVVDSQSRILSIIAGFSGKKSNSFVLKSSSLYKDIEAAKLLNAPPADINGVSVPQFLIGDEGYPLLPWLMIPFARPTAHSAEENFNSLQKVVRVFGFRTVESLKNWGVLSRPIKEEVKSLVAYIGACSILHNALLMREDYSALSEKPDCCSEISESSKCRSNAGFESSPEQKAFEIRSSLATRARRCQ